MRYARDVDFADLMDMAWVIANFVKGFGILLFVSCFFNSFRGKKGGAQNGGRDTEGKQEEKATG